MMAKRGDKEANESALLAEYSTLRDEILLRLRMRNQTLVFTIVVLGIILSLSVQKEVSPIIFFLYPILAVFLALRWAWTDVRIGDIGDYIRTKIENKVPGLEWEGHMHRSRLSYRDNSVLSLLLRPTELSAIGLFLGAGILAVALGLTKFTPSIEEWILLICDGFAIAATDYILRMRTRKLYKAGKNNGVDSQAPVKLVNSDK